MPYALSRVIFNIHRRIWLSLRPCKLAQYSPPRLISHPSFANLLVSDNDPPVQLPSSYIYESRRPAEHQLSAPFFIVEDFEQAAQAASGVVGLEALYNYVKSNLAPKYRLRAFETPATA